MAGLRDHGGVRILGRAVAEAAADERLALIDAGDAAPSWAQSEERRLVLPAVDLADDAAARAAIARVADHFGGVDVVANLAGGFSWDRVETASADDWARMLQMNVLTAVNTTRAIYVRVARGGS